MLIALAILPVLWRLPEPPRGQPRAQERCDDKIVRQLAPP
jgi:hypothetical protein